MALGGAGGSCGGGFCGGGFNGFLSGKVAHQGTLMQRKCENTVLLHTKFEEGVVEVLGLFLGEL
jgi:hypothetical protein